ncbi:MAG: ATP-binding protein [Vampirovibrionia bacterium]
MTKNNKTKRLILVDDEEMVITSIKNYLMLETDYEILTFTNPEKALEELKKTPVSLAISDFLMPEMDGIKFLYEVKNIYPQATLILLTGYADKENAIKAINDIGLYKYIEKPWDNEILKITIDNAFERTDLILELEDKVFELNKAQEELKNYNEKLELVVRQRTEALRFINAELEAIIESSADCILTLNEEFILTSSNTALERLIGCNQEKIIGKILTDIITVRDITNLTSRKIKTPLLCSNCSVYNFETEKQIPVELHIAPIVTDEHCSTHDYVIVARDITAQKEAERLREDFIATLTHDLRTPLHASIQTLDFFLDKTLGELNDKQMKYLDTMKTTHKDMLGLVNALLKVYKFESGELTLIKTNFNLIELVEQCTEEVKSLITKKNQTLEKNMSNTNITINADKNEIKRVLANFIGNAINYTPVNGKIIVNTRKDENNVLVTISDTGRGIPESDLGKLFQRFSQGTTKQRSSGTGLGLYLSRQIIEAHDGKVWVNSIENEGSTFGFSLAIKQ